MECQKRSGVGMRIKKFCVGKSQGKEYGLRRSRSQGRRVGWVNRARGEGSER
jgi:hypothetical protein